MKIHERMAAVAKDNGVGPRQIRTHIANICGVHYEAVRQWFTGDTKNIDTIHLTRFADHYNLRLEWLLSGKGVKFSDGVKDKSAIYNGALEPPNWSYVPLISWVQAGAWQEAIDLNEPYDPDRLIPCPKNHSNHTFALRVQGDSMTALSGRSYPEGAIVFVDPDLAGSVTPGDRIIAKINGDNAVTFKQLASDGSRLYLKPLNPNHPPIFDEFRVLGKVIGMWLDD